MKIAACIGSKDEAELVRHSIQHLRNIGVDHIIALDSRSTDGTRQIFEAEAAKGDLEIFDLDDSAESADFEDEADRQVLEAATRAGADWLLYCDADELWLPAHGGTLRDCISFAGSDVIRVNRFNVVLSPQGPHIRFPIEYGDYDDILFFVKPIPKWRETLQADMALPWITGVPVPKVIVNPARIVATTAGQHNVRPVAGAELSKCEATDLVIAHLPFTTLGRFERKIANIAAVIAANGSTWPTQQAWHWRRFLENVEKEGVDVEFQRNTIDREELERYRREGVVVSAAEYFDRDAQTR